MLYLISNVFLKDSNEVARSMNLKRKEWRHIPENRRYRHKSLCGHRTDHEHMIGFFTDEERRYLTAWMEV